MKNFGLKGVEMNKQTLQELIDQCVREALNEARSSPGNPNVFWLVTTISPRAPEKVVDLADGVLEGVSGISDNNRIVMHWLGINRNAVLVMNASHVMQDNRGDIDRVRYDDPYDLTRDNLAFLRRIFNADSGGRGNRRIMDNLIRQIYRDALNSNNESVRRLGTFLRDGYIPTYEVVKPYENQELEINSPKELANYLKLNVDRGADIGSLNSSAAEEAKSVDEGLWLNMVKAAITNSVRTYSSEGEWVVATDALRVPAGSKLLVAVETPLKEFPDKAQEKLRKGEEPKLLEDIPPEIWTPGMRNSIPVIKTVFEHDLDDRYDVRFIDLRKWKQIQIKLQVKHKYG